MNLEQYTKINNFSSDTPLLFIITHGKSIIDCLWFSPLSIIITMSF